MRQARVLAASVAFVLTVGYVSAQTQPRPVAPAGGRGETTATSTINGNAAHGRYIVERVAMCPECHSARDENGNIIAETRLHGGQLPVRPPWPNTWPTQTPRIARLPGYNDAQAVRLLTQGAIGRDGNQLRPPMPRFRMTPEDAADVIAYLRSVE